MSLLARRRVRWPAELVALAAVIVGGALYDANRECVSPEFHLPVTCQSSWPGAVFLVLLAAFVLAELAIPLVAVVRSRRCPRCGERVPTGRLGCEACGFDFRTIGA